MKRIAQAFLKPGRGRDTGMPAPAGPESAPSHLIHLVPVGIIMLLALIAVSHPEKASDVRLLFDAHDIGVYFRSSRWVVGEGRLYREVSSEYPLLANLIFAVWRYVGSWVGPGKVPFAYAWVLSAALVYIWAVYCVAYNTSRLATLAWLAPAPIYFALFRYDIYPAAATLLAMLAIRRTSFLEAAFFLGIAAALKGYALFLLPAFCVFVLYQRGLRTAMSCGLIALAPMAVCLLAALAFSGWTGMIEPFAQQTERKFNGESFYDAVNFVLGIRLTAQDIPLLPHALQLSCALIAAATRPRNFQDLVNAFLFALLGFLTFSPFYSPQFVLWILPVAAFSDSRAMLILALILSWVTYAYFPLAYDLDRRGDGLKVAVTAVTAIRLAMMALSVSAWHKSRGARRHATSGSGAI